MSDKKIDQSYGDVTIEVEIETVMEKVKPVMDVWGWTVSGRQYGGRDKPQRLHYTGVFDSDGKFVPAQVFAEIIEKIESGVDFFVCTDERPDGFAYKIQDAEEEEPTEPPEPSPDEDDGTAQEAEGVFKSKERPGMRDFSGDRDFNMFQILPVGTDEGFDLNVTLPAVLGGMQIESGRIGKLGFLRFRAGQRMVTVKYPLSEAINVTKAAAMGVIDQAVVEGTKNLLQVLTEPGKFMEIVPGMLDLAEKLSGSDLGGRLTKVLRTMTEIFGVPEAQRPAGPRIVREEPDLPEPWTCPSCGSDGYGMYTTYEGRWYQCNISACPLHAFTNDGGRWLKGKLEPEGLETAKAAPPWCPVCGEVGELKRENEYVCPNTKCGHVFVLCPSCGEECTYNRYAGGRYICKNQQCKEDVLPAYVEKPLDGTTATAFCSSCGDECQGELVEDITVFRCINDACHVDAFHLSDRDMDEDVTTVHRTVNEETEPDEEDNEK